MRANENGTSDYTEYMSRANRELISVVQVEGIEGARSLEKILKVPGVDVIWIGPYDLSQSLGFPGQADHPEVIQAIKEAIQRARQHGAAVAIFADGPETANNWAELGASLVGASIDTKLLFDGAKSVIERFNANKGRCFSLLNGCRLTKLEGKS